MEEELSPISHEDREINRSTDDGESYEMIENDEYDILGDMSKPVSVDIDDKNKNSHRSEIIEQNVDHIDDGSDIDGNFEYGDEYGEEEDDNAVMGYGLMTGTGEGVDNDRNFDYSDEFGESEGIVPEMDKETAETYDSYDHTDDAEESDMKEPDYDTAEKDVLVKWCFFLKAKFEDYINKTIEREDQFIQEIKFKDDRIESMEKRLTSLHPRDEELEETIDALQKCNIERQEITKKYVEAKTSLNNLTKGFKARENELKREVASSNKLLQEMYTTNLMLRDEIKQVCEKLCGELVNIEDTNRIFDHVLTVLSSSPSQTDAEDSRDDATPEPDDSESSDEKGGVLQSEETDSKSDKSEKDSEEMISLRNKLEAKENELTQLQQAFDESQAWLEETMRSALKSSTQYKTALQDKNQEIVELSEKVENLTNRIATLSTAHEAETDRLGNRINELDHKIRELTQSNELLQGKLTSIETDEKEAVKPPQSSQERHSNDQMELQRYLDEIKEVLSQINTQRQALSKNIMELNRQCEYVDGAASDLENLLSPTN